METSHKLITNVLFYYSGDFEDPSLMSDAVDWDGQSSANSSGIYIGPH